jgi:uncharacterized protein (TIGR02265 family)
MASNERLVFSSSVEALLIRGVGEQLTPAVKQELAGLGIHLDRPLLPAYPASNWNRAVDVIARRIHPDLPMAESQRKLGESTVYGFERTTLGKAMVSLSKLIGPRRALMRFPSSSRTSNNYSRMEARELGPNEIEFLCEPYEGWPEYVQGCLHAVIDLTGGKSPEVEIVHFEKGSERLVLRARWQS